MRREQADRHKTAAPIRVWPEASRKITRAVPLPVIAGMLLNRYGPAPTSCEEVFERY